MQLQKLVRQLKVLPFRGASVFQQSFAAMKSQKFPWRKLIFVFLIGVVLGLIYSPIESLSIPWFVLIIAIPFAAIIYVIAESIFTYLMEDLKKFFGGFIASIFSLLILIGGGLVGSLIFDWLTVLIKSK